MRDPAAYTFNASRYVPPLTGVRALAALLVRALAWRGEVTVTVMAVAFGLALLYGVTDELHQSFVPDRTGKAADLVWDGAGALIGVVAARLAWPIVRRWS